MAVKLTDLKKQLISLIDPDDFVQVEKVERYMDLVKSFRKINTIIRKEGMSVTTENGKQKFRKAHPLIGEQNKINASLLSIEKSLLAGKKLSGDPDDKKKKFDASDLI